MVKDFKLKPIKKRGKTLNQHLKSMPTTRMYIQMAHQFTTAPTSPNIYITHTVSNLALINILTNEKKDWMKKYYKIIREIKTIADIQL